MAGNNAIEVEGKVAEALPNTLFSVRLANGHTVLAHVAGSQRGKVAFAPGDKVILEMSLFDLSQGRIQLETK